MFPCAVVKSGRFTKQISCDGVLDNWAGAAAGMRCGVYDLYGLSGYELGGRDGG